MLTPFAQKVYRVVSTIPLGEVRSYAWVARKAGRPRACRAVGSILKRNPYPLLIPCHRVVAAHGGLGGYVFGVKHKGALLTLEKEMKAWLQDKK